MGFSAGGVSAVGFSAGESISSTDGASFSARSRATSLLVSAALSVSVSSSFSSRSCLAASRLRPVACFFARSVLALLSAFSASLSFLLCSAIFVCVFVLIAANFFCTSGSFISGLCTKVSIAWSAFALLCSACTEDSLSSPLSVISVGSGSLGFAFLRASSRLRMSPYTFTRAAALSIAVTVFSRFGKVILVAVSWLV